MARRTQLVILLVAALATSACTRPEDAISAESSVESSVTSSIAPLDDASEASDDGTAGSTATVPDAARSAAEATDTNTDTDTDTDTSADAGAPTSTASPTTTSPTRDAAISGSSTTLPSEPSDLTLIYDGVLPFRFGDRDVDVIPALTEVLGPPTLDELHEFPDADEGMFFDASGEESFVAHFGRTVCFADSLCVQFGAGAPETLIFTGWRTGEPSGLTTDEGLAIGSSLADFDDLIEFDPAVSCYQVAFGTAAGIDVTLLSDDGVFAAPDPDGDGLVLGDPDPARVSVSELRAGEHPTFVFADC